jgi:histidine triad (HIT) family protein
VTYCTFCEIIARREPATIRYEDDDVLVFDNVLGWVPVMLLVVPKRHLSQEELWLDVGAVGRVAVEMGRKYCPGGFRLLSNFGHDGMQSQPHGHIHVLGGAHLGMYVR